MRDEMCLTDDLYAGCFTVITPAERNYCRKQKLASHKCICIHLTWRRASRCRLWQRAISLSARTAPTAIRAETEANEKREAKEEVRRRPPSGVKAERSSTSMTSASTPAYLKCCVTHNIAVEKLRGGGARGGNYPNVDAGHAVIMSCPVRVIPL